MNLNHKNLWSWVYSSVNYINNYFSDRGKFQQLLQHNTACTNTTMYDLTTTWNCVKMMHEYPYTLEFKIFVYILFTAALREPTLQFLLWFLRKRQISVFEVLWPWGLWHFFKNIEFNIQLPVGWLQRGDQDLSNEPIPIEICQYISTFWLQSITHIWTKNTEIQWVWIPIWKFRTHNSSKVVKHTFESHGKFNLICMHSLYWLYFIVKNYAKLQKLKIKGYTGILIFKKINIVFVKNTRFIQYFFFLITNNRKCQKTLYFY